MVIKTEIRGHRGDVAKVCRQVTAGVLLRLCELTCVRPGVALEIKGVVEALAAEGAQVALELFVCPDMFVEELRRVARHPTHRARMARL